MTKDNENLLKEGLARLGICYTPLSLCRLEKYLSLYFAWNKKINISSIRDEQEVVIRHILDSVVIIPFLQADSIWQESFNCIDLGSGGGFPGIPLKIFEPSIKMDLAEVSKKKNCFLEEVISNLELIDINLINSSAIKVKKKYDIIFTRAFGSLLKIVKEASKYLLPRGKIIAYKGKAANITKEINELNIDYKKKIDIVKLKVPFLEEERHILILE